LEEESFVGLEALVIRILANRVFVLEGISEESKVKTKTIIEKVHIWIWRIWGEGL
jgi:hypothetical protein